MKKIFVILLISFGISSALASPNDIDKIFSKFATKINLNQEYIFLDSVLGMIKKNYVKNVDDKKIVEYALSGVLTNLDPHSKFFDEKEYEEMKISTQGEFGGIGIEIVSENYGIKVISPIDDTPAAKAGVKPGDLIFAINDQLVSNMTANEAVKKMRGLKGTQVKISIMREGSSEPIELTLTRDIIKSNPVKAHLYDNIAYIRIGSFSAQTSENLENIVKDLQKSNSKKPIAGIVLDLRNNPGGLLDQSVKVSDLFLNSGKIVTVRGRNLSDQVVFSAKNGAIIGNNIPIVVIINNGSASASEIVAAALQENKRAIVIGTKSFGKGSVQTVVPIPGYGAMSLTTARYFTPLDKSIQAEGVVPDIMVEAAKMEFIKNKEKKFLFNESDLKNHLTNQEKNLTNLKSGNSLDKEAIWQKLYDQDFQLARAIDILKSWQIIRKW